MSGFRDRREEGVDEIVGVWAPFISVRPMLLSLLYDIDMLPEQTVTFAGARRLVGLCAVWKMGEEKKLPPPPTPAEQQTDGGEER